MGLKLVVLTIIKRLVIEKSAMRKIQVNRNSFLFVILFLATLLLQSVFAEQRVDPSLTQTKPANLHSAFAAISTNGRFVAFQSAASNLVADDTNDKQDIFVYDREMNTMDRVSVSSDGAQASNNSMHPSISGDGQYIVFMSLADDLVENDDNGQFDIYVHDRDKKTTSLVSVSIDGKAGNTKSLNPVISTNGCCIVFESSASNLVESDSNEATDIFLRHINSGSTEIISIGARGQQANHGSYNPSISADGSYVVFESPARNLVPEDNKRSNELEWNFSDVFIRDREKEKTELVSINTYGKPGNHPSSHGSISADGRYVAFSSQATDLVEGYPDDRLIVGGKGRTARRVDVFVHDRMLKETKLASVGINGEPGNHQSHAPQISSNGRFVSFQSSASNLTESRMPGTTINIFRRDLQEETTTLVTDFDGPLEINVMSAHSKINPDGNWVVFDTNYGHKGAQLARESDVYIWNAQNGSIELISFAKSE